MKIPVYRKHIYGNQKVYISGEELARTIRYLTGQKTLSDAHLVALRDLGHEIVEIMPPVDNRS